MSANRYDFNKPFSLVQNRQVGTGNPDLSKFEWSVTQQRDTCASAVAHVDMSMYVGTATGESVGRVRYGMMEKMLQPCGRPPVREEGDI